MLDAARSLLFVPAHDGDAIARALASPADVVVIDLEDLTPEEHKQAARRNLRACVGQRAKGGVGVRINNGSDAMRAADLDVVIQLAIDVVLVPKSSPGAVADLISIDIPLIAVIESAAALRNAYEIASIEGVAALALGANDLAADLKLCESLAPESLAFARARLAFDSAAAGVRPPFDRVTPRPGAISIDDDARNARRMGFGGKSCLSESDAGVINGVFT